MSAITEEKQKQLADEISLVLSEFEQDTERIPKIVELLKYFDDGKPFVPTPQQIKQPVQHTKASLTLTRIVAEMLSERYTGKSVDIKQDEIEKRLGNIQDWNWTKMQQSFEQAGWSVSLREPDYSSQKYWKFSKQGLF